MSSARPHSRRTILAIGIGTGVASGLGSYVPQLFGLETVPGLVLAATVAGLLTMGMGWGILTISTASGS